MKRYHILFLVVVSLAWNLHVPVFAAMSSASFKIQSDTIDVGGQHQTSANYFSDDSVGEVASGLAKSASYNFNAGYQPMQNVYLALSSPPNVTMAPTIPGMSGGIGNGSSTWTVTTDDLAGYSLYAKASTTPALQNGVNSFADYAPSVAGVPDYAWSVASTNSAFGFSPEGANVVQKFKDNGAACNIGSLETADACWYNMISSNPGELISKSSAPNHPAGTATTVKVQAQSNSAHFQVQGAYQAVITVTAIAN